MSTTMLGVALFARGQYRIIHGIEKDDIVVYVVTIGHRGDVHRAL
jgi:mRNA-degrading endonuclease RelE of RelBE toxin-antitoxin system